MAYWQQGGSIDCLFTIQRGDAKWIDCGVKPHATGTLTKKHPTVAREK
jgi:hypothetical protein